MTSEANTPATLLPPLSALRTVARIATFVRPYRRQLVYALFALVIAAGAVLTVGQGLKGVIDHGFGAGSAAELDRMLGLMLGVVVVMAGATFTRFYFVSWLGERVIAEGAQKAHPGIQVSPKPFVEGK